MPSGISKYPVQALGALVFLACLVCVACPCGAAGKVESSASHEPQMHAHGDDQSSHTTGSTAQIRTWVNDCFGSVDGSLRDFASTELTAALDGLFASLGDAATEEVRRSSLEWIREVLVGISGSGSYMLTCSSDEFKQSIYQLCDIISYASNYLGKQPEYANEARRDFEALAARITEESMKLIPAEAAREGSPRRVLDEWYTRSDREKLSPFLRMPLNAQEKAGFDKAVTELLDEVAQRSGDLNAAASEFDGAQRQRFYDGYFDSLLVRLCRAYEKLFQNKMTSDRTRQMRKKASTARTARYDKDTEALKPPSEIPCRDRLQLFCVSSLMARRLLEAAENHEQKRPSLLGQYSEIKTISFDVEWIYGMEDGVAEATSYAHVIVSRDSALLYVFSASPPSSLTGGVPGLVVPFSLFQRRGEFALLGPDGKETRAWRSYRELRDANDPIDGTLTSTLLLMNRDNWACPTAVDLQLGGDRTSPVQWWHSYQSCSRSVETSDNDDSRVYRLQYMDDNAPAVTETIECKGDTLTRLTIGAAAASDVSAVRPVSPDQPSYRFTETSSPLSAQRSIDCRLIRYDCGYDLPSAIDVSAGGKVVASMKFSDYAIDSTADAAIIAGDYAAKPFVLQNGYTRARDAIDHYVHAVAEDAPADRLKEIKDALLATSSDAGKWDMDIAFSHREALIGVLSRLGEWDQAGQVLRAQLAGFENVTDPEPYADYVWLHLCGLRAEGKSALYSEVLGWTSAHKRKDWDEGTRLQMLLCKQESMAAFDKAIILGVFDDLAGALGCDSPSMSNAVARTRQAVADRADLRDCGTLPSGMARGVYSRLDLEALSQLQAESTSVDAPAVDSTDRVREVRQVAQTGKIVDYSDAVRDHLHQVIDRIRPEWPAERKTFIVDTVALGARQTPRGPYQGPSLDEVLAWCETASAENLPAGADEHEKIVKAAATMQYLLFASMNYEAADKAEESDNGRIDWTTWIGPYIDQLERRTKAVEPDARLRDEIAASFAIARQDLDTMLRDPFRRFLFTPVKARAFERYVKGMEPMIQELWVKMETSLLEASSAWRNGTVRSLSEGREGSVDYYADSPCRRRSQAYKSFVNFATSQAMIQYGLIHFPAYSDTARLPFMELDSQNLSYEAGKGLKITVIPARQ